MTDPTGPRPAPSGDPPAPHVSDVRDYVPPPPRADGTQRFEEGLPVTEEPEFDAD